MRLLTMLAACAAILPAAALAQQAQQVQQPFSGELPKASQPYFVANCANCHGTDGKAKGAIPPLAGRDRDYLESTLKAFKAGTKPATIMHQLAKGYTDEEIAVLAAYYSQQK